MNVPLPLRRVPRSPSAAVQQWSTSTLAHARRNAMVAMTALAERRAERDEADASVAEAVRRRAVAPPSPRRAAHGS